MTAVRPDGEGFLLICADGRRIAADRVAVCCGGFGPRLTRSLGGSLPVDLVRVQAGRFRPPFPFGPPGPIVSHHTLGVWLRPDGDDGHYLVGARADFLGRGPYRARSGQGGADLRELERLSGLVARVFPGAARGIFRGSWASWLDFTPDGNPVVDLRPAPARACCWRAACRATPSSSARRSAWAQRSSCWTARSAPSTGRPSATAASTASRTRRCQVRDARVRRRTVRVRPRRADPRRPAAPAPADAHGRW